MREAIGTTPPIGDLGFVDLIAPVVNRRETGRRADGAIDVHETAAHAADQVVMVVANPVLEPSRRPGRLDAPDQPFGDQESKGVVHGLQRDSADLAPDDVGDTVGRDVRLTRHSPEDR